VLSLHLFYGYALYNLAIQATETNKCDLILIVADLNGSFQRYVGMDTNLLLQCFDNISFVTGRASGL